MNNMISSYRKIAHTWKHKMVMIKLEKQFTGKITTRILLHDTDKVILYALFPFLGPKAVHNLHRKLTRHHQYKTDDIPESVIKEIIIDWESARYTKKEKQETARQYCLSMTPYLFKRMEPYLNKWGI